MDVKIQTQNWEIIDSGSIFLDEGFIEVIIEGLTFSVQCLVFLLILTGFVLYLMFPLLDAHRFIVVISS